MLGSHQDLHWILHLNVMVFEAVTMFNNVLKPKVISFAGATFCPFSINMLRGSTL